MKKRILSLLLILCMAVTLLPTAVCATGTVVPKGQAKIGNTLYATLGEALQAAQDNDTLYRGEGTDSSYKTAVKEKSLTLTFVGAGTGKTVWNMGTSVAGKPNGGEDGDYSFDGSEKVTFKDMTLRSSVKDGTGEMVTRNNTGFVRIQHIVVDNCIIEGRTTYWGYTDTEFHNTKFYAPGHPELNGDQKLGENTKIEYALWTQTGRTFTFDTCEFYAAGKTINVYRDYYQGIYDVTINFNNCTVNSTAPESLSVMNINDGNMGGFKYILNFSGSNTVNGIKADGIKSTAGSHASPAKDTGTKTSEQATCSKLFEFNMKSGNGNTGKTIVNIDGKPVWKDGKMVSHAIDTANDKYTDGYKDNAFTDPIYSDWTTNSDGTKTRTVTKTCNYCGYQEVTTEYEPIDWDVSKSIIAAACLNTQDHYSYLIGYSDGTVRPNGRITRAEVATIFFRLLTDDARQRNWSSENNFSDVSADKWYNNAVSTLCHMGVLGGYSDGTFRPNAPITRAEFAKIAVSFAQANGSAVYSYFTDVKTTDWFAPYVTAAKDSGLIEGYSDGSFKPENRITRAEACAIVNRVLGRKPSKNHMKISDRIDWPDCTTADWFYEAIMEATNSHTYQMGKRVETWNDKLPQRDWAALENNWASAYTGKGGEVH